ncbi:MAG: endopeptidase La [Bacilli bacterium]|nr:endopeptidase La [Bacilli bacterium]
MENKPKIILPLLITKNFVLFPSKREERLDAGRDFTVKAINASRDLCSSLLIVVCQKEQKQDMPEADDLYTVGTLCSIVSYSDLKSYVRVRVSGSQRVKLTNIKFNEAGYYESEYEVLSDVEGDAKEEIRLSKEIISSMQNNPNLWSSVPRSTSQTILTRGVTASDLADISANYLPMKTEDRQEILETLDINARLHLVLKQLGMLQLSSEVDQEIQEEVGRASEKAQKEYILREKMKAIKKELGEDPEDAQSVDSIRERLEKEPFPEHVKKKVTSELKRFDMMPQGTLEASLIKAYIDTLMDVPWYQKTEDNDDLVNVQKVLDEDHFGLEQVKKRIVEYLAVKKMTGNLKAPILCLYGPPGVGKTSLGKSVARALGRKFFKAALGGISDESEIRGHRRTYVGSMPGRIIYGMKRAGTVNPVILLDEVDKLASSYKGDPASALLEVLDPEQNWQFNDNYLEEPYDLSNVLFIATANYIENVPAPLRDRLELIEVNSYTELEKIQIAKKWLFNKQLTANGLTDKQISFTEGAYKKIIQEYTMESGVRELDRQIASIMRKAIVELLTNPDIKKVKVTDKEVLKYLGKPKFTTSKKEKNPQVGVVTGLAYTQAGGDTLPIEVNHFPGKGGIILTGKLGDVMKESASIAVDYVKANANKYEIDSKIFDTNDIHIHFPEGAIPKDGPSAGVAITLAVISALSGKQVSDLVAMTGEVNLRGHALPIGGLREKSMAALRSGIKTIIVPKDNVRDVDELPKEVKDNLEIVFMTCVDDAVKVAFVK